MAGPDDEFDGDEGAWDVAQQRAVVIGSLLVPGTLPCCLAAAARRSILSIPLTAPVPNPVALGPAAFRRAKGARAWVLCSYVNEETCEVWSCHSAAY